MTDPLLPPPHAPQKMLPPPHHGKSHRGLFIVIGVVFVVLAIWGIVSRIEDSAKLKKQTDDQAIPRVTVLKAAQAPQQEDVVLPGNVQAWHEAPVYARTSGYLKAWYTDIGAHVKTGDALADIDTPEVDAQLHQAEADLATAQANNQLAQSTAKRWEALLKTNSVSKQEADEKISGAMAQAATVTAAQANVDRLRQMEDFKHVVAPFDGVVTARNTDTGALINAGSSGTGPELFHIAETDKLRAYTQVPEIYTQGIKPDMTATLHFTEFPERNFDATLADSSHALDPVNRTLTIELQVNNEDGVLLPGSYAEVHLKVPASGNAVRLPVNTLLFRGAGMQVATIGSDNKAQLKDITIGRDYGKEVEVVSGVDPGETIIVNPPDSLISGEEVRVVTPEQKEKENKKSDAKEDKKTSKEEKADKADKSDEDNKVQKSDAPRSSDNKSGDNPSASNAGGSGQQGDTQKANPGDMSGAGGTGHGTIEKDDNKK